MTIAATTDSTMIRPRFISLPPWPTSIIQSIFSRSVCFALSHQLLIGLAGVIVVLFRLVHFVGFDEALLLRPALVHAFQTPFRAALRGAHRLIAHLHPDWIRVRR